MKKIYLLLIAILTSLSGVFAQADCSSAVTICGNTTFYNPSGIGNKLEQLACGGIEHNSIWLAFQAKASGKLNFVIRSYTTSGLPTAADFDWSLYQLAGPPNSGNCDAKTQLSCNFSGTATVFGIPGATGMATPNYGSATFNPGIDVVNGTWYVLLVDQFSNTTPLVFNVQFTGSPETPYINSTPGIFDNRPDFTINNAGGCGGTYNFTNTSVAAAGIASYLWEFGDGSTSTAASPSHTYVTTGTYYVTLTVTDNNGCKTVNRKMVAYNNTPPTVNNAGILLLPSCTDTNNGSITVTTIGATTPGVTGGTPPYTYELVSPSAMIRPSQSSNTFTGLQPGSYTLKVTDACGKSATNTSPVTVSQVITNSTIGLGIQNIQSACTGTPSGAATIFANGASAPITMALVATSPVTTGPLPAIQRDPVTATYFTTFTGLLPGVYTVEAVDGCGKLRRATFTVTASTAPTVGVVNSASCAGVATGTINVTATAGTGLTSSGAPGTFQYALLAPSPVTRPFQSSSVFENLLPGTYTVAVRDICGNVGTATSTIATAPAPTFGTPFTTLSCPNGATGTIEAQVSAVGGGTPFTFELIAPSVVTRPSQPDNTFTGLPPGAYTIRLADACATSVTSTFTIGAATAPTFTPTVTGSCSAPASGTITIAPGASTIGPYTFELISPGAAIRPPQPNNIANSNSSIFTGLDQGPYTIRMTDGCGTPVTGTATITAPTALVFPTGSATVPSCAAGSTGQITVAQPTTGLSAYKYELIAPSPVIRPQQYSRIFNNLPTGSYTVRITDSCGSQVTIGTPIDILAAATPSLTVTNTSSCATNTGTITALANNNQGGGTYLFALIAPSPVTRPNQASPIFTGLPDGSYTVQITDQCGATGTVSTTIALAGAFTPAAGGSVVGCNGSNYNAQIIVTNPQNYTPGGPIPPGSGGGPYTYALYDAGNTTLLAGPQSSNVFMTVVPVFTNPSHTVRVTDGCGNTGFFSFAITTISALTAPTISAITASCAASNTGIIRVTTAATGGLAPYSYTLMDATATTVIAGPQTGIVFNGVADAAAGYTIRVTDACGNVMTNTTPVLFPAAVAPTGTVATTASCVSPSTGRIVVTPTTGSTQAGGAYTYALYDVTNTTLISGPQSSPLFQNLPPADYTVRMTDRCGTVGTIPATIASGVAAPTAAGNATGTCPGGNTGVITGSSTGGSLPVTYTLVDAGTNTVITGPQAGNIFTGLAAATYIVRVTDACGSVANSANIVVADLTALPTLSTTTALDCAGSVTLSAYGGSGNGGPYTYAICNGAGCSTFGAFSTNSSFIINTSGTYRIAVRDRCGNQTNSSDIAITIPVKAVITGLTKNTNCGPTNINVTFSGVTGTAYFSLDGANFAPTIPMPVGLGAHTIRVADFNGGSFGCASDAFNFFVATNPAITNPVVNTGTQGLPFSQTFTQSGGETPVNFTTTSTLPAGISLSAAGVLSGTPTVNGLFPIVVTATDINGCIGTGTTYNLNIAASYCVPSTTNGCANGDSLAYFSLKGSLAAIYNPSGPACNGSPLAYSDYTGVFPALAITRGETFGGFMRTGNANDYASMWIDADDDGIFQNSERILSNLQVGTTKKLYSVYIPATIPLGNHRLRVRVVNYASTPGTATDPCTLYANGETEDYLVDITNVGTTRTVATGTPGSCILTSETTVGPESNNDNATRVFLVDSSNNYIAGITPNGNDLGIVSASVYVHNGAVRQTPAPQNSYYLDRNITITASKTATTTYSLRYFYLNSELNALIAQPGSGVTSQFDLNMTKTATNTCSNIFATNSSVLVAPTGFGLLGSNRFLDFTNLSGFSSFFLHGGPMLATCPVITVTNPANTTGTAGTVFSETFTAAGGATPYTYSTLSTLPAGLTLSAAGVLSGTPTEAGTFPIVVTATDLNSCTGTSATYNLVIGCPPATITLTSAPATTSQTVCVNSPITNITYSTTGASGATFSGLPAGVTGSWAANVVTISGTPTTAVGSPFSYTVSLTLFSGCPAVTASGTITVNPGNAITLTSATGTDAQTVCNNTAITNITYSTIGATGAGFSGLPAGVTGNWAANVVTISGTPTTTAGSPFNYTVTLTGGCGGVVTATGTITVNPTPTVNAVANQVVCNSTATTAVTFTGTPSGVVFNWTNSDPSIGLAASGTGDIASFTATNPGSAPVSGTITVTPAFYANNAISFDGNDDQVNVVPSAPVNNLGVSGFTLEAWVNPSAVNGARSIVRKTGDYSFYILNGSIAAEVWPISGINNTWKKLEGSVANVTANTWTHVAATWDGTILRLYINGVDISGSATLTNGTIADVNENLLIGRSLVYGNPYAGYMDEVRIWNLARSQAQITTNMSSTVPAVTPLLVGYYRFDEGQGINTSDNSGNGNSGLLENGAVWLVPSTAPISGDNTTVCNGTPINFTITVNPTPDATATPSSQSVCSGTAMTTVAMSSTTSGVIFNWTRDNGTINSGPVQGIPASSVGGIGGTPVNTTNAPVTVTFTITPSYTNAGVTCTGTPITATLIVNPTPDVTATPSSQTRCSGASIQAIIMGGSVSGTSFDWVRDNVGTVGGNIPANGSGNITGFFTNNTANPITVTFTITPTANGCPGTPVTATVTVNPLPLAIINGGGAYVCQNSGYTLSANTDPNYHYAWGISNFGAPFNPLDTFPVQPINRSGNILLTVTNQYGCIDTAMTSVFVADYVFNGSLAPGDAIQTGRLNRFAVVSTCASPKACPGIFTSTGNRLYDSYTITNPRNTPVCAIIGIQSFCGTNIFCAAYTGSYDPANQCVNYLADPGSSFLTAGFYEATIPANGTIVVVVHEVNVATGCAGYRLSVDVPRDTTPVIVTPNDTVCTGTPVTLTAPFANTYLWTPGGATTQSINVTPALGTNTYSVRLGYGNVACSTNVSKNVVVSPTPDVNPVTNQQYCEGSTTPVIPFAGTVPGTTYNWTNNNTAIGLGASGTGDLPSFTATNATASPITGTITVTPVNGSCTGAPMSFTITVANIPMITAVTHDTTCGPGVVNLAATANGMINWYDSLTGGTLINSGNTYSPNLSATDTFYVEAQVVTPPVTTLGMPAQSSTFPGNVRGYWFTAPADFVITALYVPTTASSGVQHVAVLKFNGNTPPPVFSASTNAFTTLFLTRNNASAGKIFTNIQVRAGEVIGILGNRANLNSYAPGDYATTIMGLPVQLERMGMQFPLSSTNPRDIWREFGPSTSISRIEFDYAPLACSSSPRVPVYGVVKPLPVATATPPAQTICSGSAITAIALTGTEPGTVYAWTRDNNATVTGIAANGTGNTISGSLTNTTNAPVTVTFTITPEVNGCFGLPVTATVVVNPVPDAVATPASQTICSGSAITTIALTGNVVGTVYNWTRDNTVNVTGIATPGSGDISGTLTNTTNVAQTVTFTITPEFTNAGTTCTGTPITATVIVNPTPTVNAVASQVVCNNTATAPVNFSGAVAGTVYNWTNNNPFIGLGGSGTGNIPGFTATNAGTAPEVATITVTPSYTNAGTTCTGTPITFTITVNPTATVNAIPNQVLCNGATSTPVNFTSPTTGGTIVYNWTNDNTTIGLGASGTGNIPAFTAVNIGTAPVVATITVTPTYTNGSVSCVGTPMSFTITVNPPPVIDPVASQVVCNGAPTANINFTTPASGGVAVFNWTNDNTSIGLAASGTGDILSFNATNATNAPVTATITVTLSYTNGGVTCVSLPLTFTITVNPTPQVDQPANQVLCAGQPTAAVNFTSPTTGGTLVFNWTNNNPSIGLAASGSGNIASFISVNTTNVPQVATIVVTPSFTNGATTCTGPSKTFTITVNPLPTVAPVSNKAYCTGATTAVIPFNGTAGGTVAGTQYNWTNSNTAIGLAASGTGDIMPFVTTNATNGPLVATITVTPVGPTGCVGTPITFTITVNPTPIVNPVAGQVLCNGQPTAVINFTSPTTGPTGALSFQWTNSAPSIGLAANGSGNIPSFTAINTGLGPVTALVTVTPVYTNAGITCTGASQTFTIVVNPTPTVNAVADQVLCNGSATAAVNFTGSVFGTIYNWTNNNTSIGLAASGAGNIASFVATNATNVPQVATITVTPNYTNTVTCPGTPVTFTITVNPIPVVTPPSSQVVCAGSTVTQTFTGTVAGTVYSWTNTNTAIGLAASGTGNLNFTATNTTGAPLTGTITVTPSYTNAGGTCTGAPQSFTITVNPIPTVNAVASQVRCNGSATAAVTFSGTVAGTVYSWTNSNTTIGLAASGTGNIASFTATNTTNAPVTATITVTPTFTNGVTCTGVPVTFTITVNPTPSVNTIANQTVCNGTATTAITIAGPVAGTVYSWTNNNTSIGLGASGTATIPSFLAFNAGSTPQVATITVTPTYTNGGTSCTGPATTFTITVNPTAVVNQPASQVVCNGAGTTAVTFSGLPPGSTYNWTNTNTAIGLAASGSGNIASFVATNTTAAPITATITVTPTSTGCGGIPVSFTITVNPTPSVNAIANQAVCSGSSTTAVTLSGPVAGTVYSWSNSNPSIGLAPNGVGNIPAFTANNPGNTPRVATITVTPTYTNGGVSCTGNPVSFTITVNPLPDIIFTNVPPRVCLTDTIVTLTATPGGSWSGPGISGNTFSAAVAGVGVHRVTYTATNGFGCTTTRFANIVVNDCIERHNVFQQAIRIWPNPNDGRFSLQFNSDKYKEFKVKVVNARGQEMAYYEFKNLVYGQILPFNLTRLAAGEYFIYVYNTQESGVFPIIIQR